MIVYNKFSSQRNKKISLSQPPRTLQLIKQSLLQNKGYRKPVNLQENQKLSLKFKTRNEKVIALDKGILTNIIDTLNKKEHCVHFENNTFNNGIQNNKGNISLNISSKKINFGLYKNSICESSTQTQTNKKFHNLTKEDIKSMRQANLMKTIKNIKSIKNMKCFKNTTKITKPIKDINTPITFKAGNLFLKKSLMNSTLSTFIHKNPISLTTKENNKSNKNITNTTSKNNINTNNDDTICTYSEREDDDINDQPVDNLNCFPPENKKNRRNKKKIENYQDYHNNKIVKYLDDMDTLGSSSSNNNYNYNNNNYYYFPKKKAFQDTSSNTEGSIINSFLKSNSRKHSNKLASTQQNFKLNPNKNYWDIHQYNYNDKENSRFLPQITSNNFFSNEAKKKTKMNLLVPTDLDNDKITP